MVPTNSYPKVSVSKQLMQVALNHGKGLSAVSACNFQSKTTEPLNQWLIIGGLEINGRFYAKRQNPTYIPLVYMQGGCPIVILNLIQDSLGVVFQGAALCNQHEEIQGVPHKWTFQRRQRGKWRVGKGGKQAASGDWEKMNTSSTKATGEEGKQIFSLQIELSIWRSIFSL